MAQETLLAEIPTPKENIHRIAGELPPSEAATKYEAEIQKFFGAEPPVFDLILLGLGGNAHTASLFPHTSALNETKHWVTSVYVEEISMSRITMTVPLINQAREIIFLVSGADKATAVQQVLEGSYQPHDYPAQLIRPEKARPVWLLDHAAGHKLMTDTLEAA
jgi:6-phosphogluconolactonase